MLAVGLQRSAKGCDEHDCDQEQGSHGHQAAPGEPPFFRRLGDDPAGLDGSSPLDGELLNPRLTPEAAGRLVGQPDVVAVLPLLLAEHLPGQLFLAVAAPIEILVVAGGGQGGGASLVQRDEAPSPRGWDSG